jgi:single-stranded DNA-specific DHH superfamily exonuclease
MLEAISQMARPAAEKIRKQKFVRVVSHHDADGITACGIVCLALRRQHIPFQATIVSNLDSSIDAVLDPAMPVIFCDMGSGQPDIVNKYDAVILDHHMPQEGHKNIHVNPHLVGIDGADVHVRRGLRVRKRNGNNTDRRGWQLAPSAISSR